MFNLVRRLLHPRGRAQFALTSSTASTDIFTSNLQPQKSERAEWLGLSESALAKVWNNPGDAIYDRADDCACGCGQTVYLKPRYASLGCRWRGFWTKRV